MRPRTCTLLCCLVLLLCAVLRTTGASSATEAPEPSVDNEQTPPKAEARRIASNDFAAYAVDDEYAKRDHHAAFRKRAKPLKNIFMGIYKNYKSTYIGNKTSLEYKQTLLDRISPDEEEFPARDTTEASLVDAEDDEHAATSEASEVFTEGERQVEAELTDVSTTTESALIPWNRTDEDDGYGTDATSTLLEDVTDSSAKWRKRKRKHQREQPASGESFLDESERKEYNIGPGVNMSLDMTNDIVKVRLNGGNLRELLHGRWLNDNTERGRSKKYEMVSKVLPLFILPFLIQSAIVPFLVTKLKLLLMKSILVGKLAIFLLIISAIKNSNKMMQTYEVGPSYWAGEPSRRSELAAAASSAYSGYRVEGKPAAWIN